jgi:hypothetical protein
MIFWRPIIFSAHVRWAGGFQVVEWFVDMWCSKGFCLDAKNHLSTSLWMQENPPKYTRQRKLCEIDLKGVWNEIFDFRFFINQFTPNPLVSQGPISNLYENSWRYSNVKVFRQCCRYRQKINRRCHKIKEQKNTYNAHIRHFMFRRKKLGFLWKEHVHSLVRIGKLLDAVHVHKYSHSRLTRNEHLEQCSFIYFESWIKLT